MDKEKFLIIINEYLNVLEEHINNNDKYDDKIDYWYDRGRLDAVKVILEVVQDKL